VRGTKKVKQGKAQAGQLYEKEKSNWVLTRQGMDCNLLGKIQLQSRQVILFIILENSILFMNMIHRELVSERYFLTNKHLNIRI